MVAPRKDHKAGAIAAKSKARKRKVKPDNRDPDTVKAQGKMGGRGCWCGQPYGHDWAGKADGKPHPR